MRETLTTSDIAADVVGDFACPYCAGRITVGKVIEGDVAVESGTPMVLHTMPPCEKYLQEDMLVFLRNARVKAFGPEPDDDEWPVNPPKDDGAN